MCCSSSRLQSPWRKGAVLTADELKTYKSNLTGPELDEALRNIYLVQENVEKAAGYAETSEKYGTIVEQNQAAIQAIEDNLDLIQRAPQNAQTAQQAAEQAGAQATAAAGSADAAAQSEKNAAYWADQAQTIAQGAVGWYQNAEELRRAHPTGENGQWAIVGDTNTIWTWDSDSGDWINTAPQANASTLGMVKIHDTPDGIKTAAGGWAASPAAVQALSADIYMVRTYANYSESNPRLLVAAIGLPSGINAGINQFAVSVEVENEADAAYQHFVQISSNRANVYFRKADGSNFSNGNVVWFNALIIVNR